MIANNDFLAYTLAYPERNDVFDFVFPSGHARIEGAGILCLEPEKQQSKVSLVLSVGIHGNETGPIELVNGLVKSILVGDLVLGIRLLFIIGNPRSAVKAQRFCDVNLNRLFCDVNLNRLFCGSWQSQQGYEIQRAQQLESSVKTFFEAVEGVGAQRLHYDLHTAIRGSIYEKFAVHPFVPEETYQQQQLAFLAACGIEAVLFSHQPTTTFSYHSFAQHSAQAFTIELGKVRVFGENDLSSFALMKQSLVVLLVTGVLAQGRLSALSLYEVLDSLIKDHDSYRLNIADELENFTPFKQYFCLAESLEQRYIVKQTGDAIVFPNTKLPVGQRAGLVVRSKPMSAFNFQ
ncbi:succinylglutamate desuccinylase [Marinomonas posidonica]|uniref:Succinylglutamate desuccinylase n=1 Tax=Marinomonas posidonica (strain CECT 7376 / NCIMB 14433 / IVIA-Po-181) TaxID=491952 RepID=F6CYS5_MARPP|nr:succinylglutamate desuccinylase [Marinomonas posidonica]AEF55757.1 Succinylglutamate desuccinylase [Marinomonas posidonica IVIA-Po-181]